LSSNAGLAQTFAESGAGCHPKPNEPAPRARPRPDTRRALKLPAAEMAPFDRFVAADVSRRQSFCERRRRGIVVASGRLQGSSSVGATSSSPCRPYGARTSLRIRCYKDVAPDGAEQRRANQSRLTSAPPARGSGRAPLRRRRGERQLRPASAGLTGQGPCLDQSGRLAKAAGALLCQSRRVRNAGDTLPGQSRRVGNGGDALPGQSRRVGNGAASRPRRSGVAGTGRRWRMRVFMTARPVGTRLNRHRFRAPRGVPSRRTRLARGPPGGDPFRHALRCYGGPTGGSKLAS